MHVVAKIESQEAFVLAIMVNIAVWAAVLKIMGLPPALGAFLAGMLMSETVYRHQVNALVEPYATLFLAFFFIVLGMGIDLPFLHNHWEMVLVGCACLVLIKFFALFMVARVRHVSVRDATLMSLILAQGGEFGLLILQTMKTNGIEAIPTQHQELLIAIIAVSIMVTPIVIFIYDQLVKFGVIFNGTSDKKLFQPVKNDVPTVIICGFGRMGQIVAEMLNSENISYIAVDGNVDNVIMARESGYNVIYGDCRKKTLLVDAGFKSRKTRAAVIAVNDAACTEDIVHTLRSMAPRIKIFARAHNLETSKDLMAMGVKSATPEIIESSFIVGENLMASLGLSKAKINTLVENLRENNYANVKKPIEVK